MERASVETAAYKEREQTQLWDFLPDADYECPISETPREVRTRGRRWLGQRPSYVATETTQISLGVTHGYTTSFLMADILGSKDVQSAKQYGMDCILFTNTEAFVAELAARDISIGYA